MISSFIESERENTSNFPATSAISRRGGHVFASSELTWRGDKLCLGPNVLLVIVPDERNTGMWRIRAGGELSDMVNRTRARDAARSAAVALLNGGRYAGRQGGADAICRRKDSPAYPKGETRTSEPTGMRSRPELGTAEGGRS
jgi:hypothetical protein